jgi:hypothetical protein
VVIPWKGKENHMTKRNQQKASISLLILLYLSYNFLYKNQLDSFTIFPGLHVCREVYLTGQ